MNVLAIDPGLKSTAWAVVDGSGATLALRERGWITPSRKGSGGLWERCRSIVDQLDAAYRAMDGMYGGMTVAVEFPQTVAKGLGGLRSAATLPNYGVCVGAVAQWASGLGLPLLTPSATEWTRGFPSTRKDPHKLRRVAHAASIFGVTPATFGPKSIAGNVADAALLGAWATRHPVCR